MEQFDKAIKNTTETNKIATPANIIILGSVMSVLDAIRGSLEVCGHYVSQATSIASYEKLACSEAFNIVFVSADDEHNETRELFELVSLIQSNTIVVGFSKNPNPNTIIQFIRDGGVDFFNVPTDLDNIGERIQSLLQEQRKKEITQEKAKNALQLCDKLNKERQKVEEENDALSNELANAYCETKKKMQQVAIGAEFQTLVSQELDVESMLRTALGYMLTRVGAMNAAVYLREGTVDWGIGAYINYDRQSEQFQSLIDSIGIACCPTLGEEEQVKHFKNGEMFASVMGLESADFAGNEVVTYGCYSGDRCMAVVVLFRDDSRAFTSESLDTIETLRSIFGQQLGTILKIHSRASSKWPSESIDDDDWSIDKAA